MFITSNHIFKWRGECQLLANVLHRLFLSSKQPHSIVQRRLLEGNITRLRGEARDPGARVRSPLADAKDGQADAEERSESTADDSTEERESLEESERSLRSDEEDDSSEAAVQKARGTEGSAPLAALVVQCKVQTSLSHWLLNTRTEGGGQRGSRGLSIRKPERQVHVSVARLYSSI